MFETPSGAIQTAFEDTETGAAGRLLAFISRKETEFPFDHGRPFNVAVEMHVKFVRRSSPDPIPVQPGSRVPGSVPIVVTEEQTLVAYAWRYPVLCQRLAERYSDFKVNEKYHRIRRRLERDTRFCKARRLDPDNPGSTTKNFYNPNIIAEFDRHYTKRSEEET